MMTNRFAAWIAGTLLMFVMASNSVGALNISTHRLVNVAAAATEEFEQHLLNAMGLRAGRTTRLVARDGVGRSIEDWLGEGGEREDDGLLINGRFHNHFHNPLRPWAEAGLHALRHQPSSIHWMQDPAQSPGGNWTWQRARQLYLQALTAPDARAREEAAADMFRALGQIMHLVVDASVPEHTRSDAHPLGTLLRETLNRRRAGNYEYWVSDQHTRSSDAETAAAEAAFRTRYLSSPIGFDPAVLAIPLPPGETLARVPVARLIDADKYQGESPDPNVTLAGAIGLAEFANANFFSEDTLTGQFPFPRREHLTPSPRVAPKGAGVRRYLAKPPGQGLPTSVALAECVSEYPLARWVVNRPSPYPCVDEAVWEETAAHMLPRAVGYARGVLDYFFRGKIGVRRVAVIGSQTIFIDIENRSDEPMDGIFEVYGRYQKGSSAEERLRFVTLNNGNPIALPPGQWNRFPLAIPSGLPTGFLVLVFRGRMGLEDDAVAGQMFAVPHVQIVQAAYDAEVTSTCTVTRLVTSNIPLRDLLECTWRPANHRADVRLVSNFGESDSENPADPVIEQIQAGWEGGTLPGAAPLRVNGADYPDGIWRRIGDEPDPAALTVLDPAVRGTSRLMLRVSVRGGGLFTSQLATFTSLRTSAHRQLRRFTLPGWYLYAGRAAALSVNIDTAGFSAASIGGYPIPTSILGAALPPGIVPAESLTTSTTQGGTGSHSVNAFVEHIGSTFVEAEAKLNAVPLIAPPFPAPPALDFSAVVIPRAPSSGTLLFLKTFFAAGGPEQHSIVLRAHQPGD